MAKNGTARAEGIRKVCSWIAENADRIGKEDAAEAIGVLLGTLKRRSGKGLSAPRDASAQARKPATVLFADIVGFTSLAERLDPEYVTELVNSLWEGLDLTVTRFGGTIDKHIGDAVMALWGCEGAHEDDAERAIECALAMSGWLADYSERFAFSDGSGLSKPLLMRIGIHSGLVLYGPIGTIGERSAIGDAVNCASRVESAAEPGTILVSEPVFRATSGVFDFKSSGSLAVKGKSEPIAAYLALRKKDRPARSDGRGIAGIAVGMVGRDRELESLVEAFDASSSGTGRVAVVGDPGIGKSRLLREFMDKLELREESIPLLIARCLPSSAREPYGVLRSMLSTRFSILDSDGSLEAGRKFREGFGAALESGGADPERAREKAALTAVLLGFAGDAPGDEVPDDPRTLASRALAAFAEFACSFAPRRPLVVVEDLHWADAKSVEVLARLFPPEARCLVVATARPVVSEAHPGFLESFVSGPARLVRVSRLSDEESLGLAGAILHGLGSLPEGIERIVREKAEGNPYFVEELARMLVDKGVVSVSGSPWRFDASLLLRLDVPETLGGILQSRIDTLPERDRLALMGASVIGRTFWDGAVVSVLREKCKLAKTVFNDLSDKELVFASASSAIAGIREYVFKHALLRDVAYENILKRDRPRYHENAARWLLDHSGGRAEGYAGTIAEHFEKARRYGEAMRFYRMAGNKAAGTWDNAAATAFFGKAIDLSSDARPSPGAEERFELVALREGALDRSGDRVRQLADLSLMGELAEQVKGGAKRAVARAEARIRMANYRELTGELDAAFEAADEVREIARRVLDAEGGRDDAASRRRLEELEAESIYRRGRALWRKGKVEEAMPYLVAAVEESRRTALAWLQTLALRNLGAARSHRGEWDEAIRLTELSLDIARRIGDDSAIGSALNNLGDIMRFVGRYAEARARFIETYAIHKKSGERWALAYALANLALVSFRMGAYDEAQAFAREGLECSLEIGLKPIQATSHFMFGHLRSREGDMDGALAEYGKGLALALELGNGAMAAEGRAYRAKTLLAKGEREDARTTLESSMDAYLCGTLEGIDDPYHALLSCVESLEALDDPRADEVLRATGRALARTAAMISDPGFKRGFLHGVGANEEIARRIGLAFE